MKKTLSILSVVVFGGLLSTAHAGDHERSKDARKSFCEGISREPSFIEAPPATIENALRDCLSQCNESSDSESSNGTPEFACVTLISATLQLGVNIAADQLGGIVVTGRCLRERKCATEIGVIGPGLPDGGGPDCSAVSCLVPECAAGEILETPSNECCPVCVPDTDRMRP